MAYYKTFNIDFIDWHDNSQSDYEIARDIKEALAKFYDEIKHDCGLTRIVDIYESQSENYYILEVDEDIFEYRFDTIEDLFYDVSKVYAFDDCCPEFQIKKVVCGGRPVRYLGWQPMMKFEYVYDDGETAWTCYHEEWEH